MSNPDHPSLSVVGLGGSAGGIKALLQFFHAMPSDSGMAFVVILHLSDQHDSTLDQILRTKTKMEVSQVTETVNVEPNHVYVIPPAKHLEMVDGTIRLTEPERIRGRRVPIDHDGRSGLAVAEEFQPDTALLDIGLPDMEGYDVARELRKKFPSSNLIAVSGWGQEDDVLRAKAAGFDSHLVKPVEIDGILRLMNSK